ncbi:MAG: DUF2793 domain-containing protein [Litoreibacter sp.]
MSDTANLNLPLLASSQAQKHVTMNEALTRIDAALQLRVVSRGISTPPTPTEGEVFIVGISAQLGWAGKEGQLAFAIGNGWDFIAPQAGWKIWVDDEARWACFDGIDWMDNVVASSVSGASFRAEVLEFDFTFTGAGGVIDTDVSIPAGTSVMAITGLILDAFDGTLSDWSLGVAGSDGRYGSGLGKAADAWIRGLTGQPQTYYADTPLRLVANGGDFGAGRVRLCVHLMQFGLPRGD